MALIIRDRETEQLAAEVAFLIGGGESETGAIQVALRETFDRLAPEAGRRRRPGDLGRFLETEIWPLIPGEMRNKPPMTKAERERILGLGREGR